MQAIQPQGNTIYLKDKQFAQNYVFGVLMWLFKSLIHSF